MPMRYAARTTLETAFGAEELVQIADRDGDGEPDATLLTAVLSRADVLIDGYLAGRYALPLAAPPPVLVAVAADLARYWLYDDAAPEQVRKRYEDALACLKDVASGKVLLALPPVAVSPSGSPEHSAPARRFTTETLARY